jgi:cytochrome c-type biogenesis protein CcmH
MKAVIAFLLMMMSALAAPAFSNTASADAPAVADTFSNPATEARARNLQRQLRCLVCQGESIDESGSPFAADVRHLVRQQIAQGQSDRQIQDFLVARYGDFILMKPPVQPDTWLLWLAPFLVLGAGGAVAWMTIKKAASRGV